ncbi:integral membrane protein [Stagonosporopsis vannaccii]|nr:integral membrane protein [Stagonosporopsis vannaccii]
MDAILNGPALAPPPGVKPNFDDPKDLSHPELAILQLLVATLVVAMRVYTKMGVLRNMLVEDCERLSAIIKTPKVQQTDMDHPDWLIIAWLGFAGFHGIVFMMEALPMGIHQWDLTARRAIEHAKLFHIAVAIYALIIIPLKVSLILQIRRIFMPHNHSLHARPFVLWVIDSFLVLNVIFYLALFLFQFLACRPLPHAWNPLIPGTCVRNKLFVHIVSASINTASDLIIVILPQPVIWRLELSSKRKWGLSAVFLLGALACTASSVRLYHAIRLYYSTDLTYRAALMGKWAEPELTFGFLAACLPVLPAFLKHVLRTSFGLKIRSLWTQSPPTEGISTGGQYGGSGGRQVRTIGSYGRSGEKGSRITKVVEMDIEFEELTRETRVSRDGAVAAMRPERSYASSPERDEEWVVGSRGVRQQASVGPLRI